MACAGPWVLRVSVLLLLLLQTWGTTIIVTPAPATFAGDLREAKYLVAINSGAPSVLTDAVTQRTVVMTDEAGARYACVLPLEEGATPAEAIAAARAPAAATDPPAPATAPSAASLVTDLSTGPCFYRHEGWWTYELCVGKHVRQFHHEKDVVLSEYVLGKYDADATAAAAASSTVAGPAADTADGTGHGSGEREANNPGNGGGTGAAPPVRAVVQLYTNGTDCAITARPRSISVTHVCAPDGITALGPIREPSSCTYTVTLHAATLCRHPHFSVDETPLTLIQCDKLGTGAAKDSTHEDHAAAVGAAAPAAAAAAPAPTPPSSGGDDGGASRAQVDRDARRKRYLKDKQGGAGADEL